MGVASNVLRVLSDFGDAAGWLIAAIVLIAYGRRILQENKEAHAAITTNVQENRKRVDENRTRLDAFGQTLQDVARDVAILRDRSDRTQQPGPATAPRV